MFIYSVYYYNDIDGEMDNDKGLVSAATFGEATDKVVNKLYNNVASVAIHSLETSEDGYATFEELKIFSIPLRSILRRKIHKVSLFVKQVSRSFNLTNN